MHFLADQAAFRGQNISQIFNLMDQTLARLFPKVKSIYYVPPIAIDREQTPHAIQIYNQLLEQGKQFYFWQKVKKTSFKTTPLQA